MPKLQVFSKTKKENYGIQRHDSYNVIIPYKVVQDMNMQDNMLLYATTSVKTGTIRLHTKPLKDCVTVKIRQRLTKTYRNQRYYSSKVTIPIEFARLLHLKKNDNLTINCNKDTIIIKKMQKKNDNLTINCIIKKMQ